MSGQHDDLARQLDELIELSDAMVGGDDAGQAATTDSPAPVRELLSVAQLLQADADVAREMPNASDVRLRVMEGIAAEPRGAGSRRVSRRQRGAGRSRRVLAVAMMMLALCASMAVAGTDSRAGQAVRSAARTMRVTLPPQIVPRSLIAADRKARNRDAAAARRAGPKADRPNPAAPRSSKAGEGATDAAKGTATGDQDGAMGNLRDGRFDAKRPPLDGDGTGTAPRPAPQPGDGSGTQLPPGDAPGPGQTAPTGGTSPTQPAPCGTCPKPGIKPGPGVQNPPPTGTGPAPVPLQPPAAPTPPPA